MDGIGSFMVGDLVRFISSYGMPSETMVHGIGIVIDVNTDIYAHDTYKVWWLHSDSKLYVSGNYLTLAYELPTNAID